MPVDIEEMRLAMRQWSSGVTIVSATDGVTRQGMTVSSFTSILFEPPQVLVALQYSTRTCQMVTQTGIYGVTILAEGQQMLSERFAGRLPEWEKDRFAGVDTDILVSGVPFIRDGLAYFDCRVVSTQPVGENTLFISEVIAARSFPDRQPLVYFNRKYRQLGQRGSE